MAPVIPTNSVARKYHWPHVLSASPTPMTPSPPNARTNARWEMQKALDYINEQRGRFFDPACLDAFMAQLDRISQIQFALGDQEKDLTANR